MVMFGNLLKILWVKNKKEEMDNQVVGNSVFDEYPTYEEWIKLFDMEDPYPNMFKLQEYHFQHLAVWINGNAYFNRARKWKKEINCFEDKEHEIYVNLEVKDGEYRIDTCTNTLGDLRLESLTAIFSVKLLNQRNGLKIRMAVILYSIAIILVITAVFLRLPDHLQKQKGYNRKSVNENLGNYMEDISLSVEIQKRNIPFCFDFLKISLLFIMIKYIGMVWQDWE